MQSHFNPGKQHPLERPDAEDMQLRRGAVWRIIKSQPQADVDSRVKNTIDEVFNQDGS